MLAYIPLLTEGSSTEQATGSADELALRTGGREARSTRQHPWPQEMESDCQRPGHKGQQAGETAVQVLPSMDQPTTQQGTHIHWLHVPLQCRRRWKNFISLEERKQGSWTPEVRARSDSHVPQTKDLQGDYFV
jgi:hypothetical protein